jgi:hypothetical protein
LPIVFGVTAAASLGPDDGRYVLIDEYAVGALPDSPYAPRRPELAEVAADHREP